MGVKVNKERFLKELHYKKVYCVNSAHRFFEHILTGDQYNYFLSTKNGEKEIKNLPKNNLPIRGINENIKLYTLDPRSMIEQYNNYAGANDLFRSLKHVFNDVKDRSTLHSKYEKAYDRKLYIISETLDIEAPFARTEDEFFKFFSEREIFYFNEQKGAVEMIVAKPSLKIRELHYLHNQTHLKVGFELVVNEKTITESSLYYYNNKFYVKEIFESQEQLINYHTSRLQEQLAYFESLKGDKPEGTLISNKCFVL